ncbi:hypothetical protein ACIBCM_23435 [Streptomyces sp. NPDC051018]|uniref:hypothetical protein n=1 Tax=Streptomyces sp. NPDC051018 TaxID=3365639 RepID=UPI0037AF2B1E
MAGLFEVFARVGGAVGGVAKDLDRLGLICRETLGDLRLVVLRPLPGPGPPR